MIALIGGAGNIGRRYQAILHVLRVPFKIFDLNDPLDWTGIKKAIITTPTSLHFESISQCQKASIPFLCEKPISKNVQDLKELEKMKTSGFMVNNYQFLEKDPRFPHSPKQIAYDFYNTGRDGLLWDVCQLVYLSEIYKANLIIRRKSWTWKLLFNDFPVPYQAIEKSYYDMIKCFIDGNTEDLWTLWEAMECSKLCMKLEASLKKELTDEGFIRRSGALKLEPISEEDLPKDRR